MSTQNAPIHIQYQQKTQGIYHLAAPQNPNYKSQIGEAIYEYVEIIAGEDNAPKVTGMLIDLPIEDIKAYLVNYGVLQEKVREAMELLNKGQ